MKRLLLTGILSLAALPAVADATYTISGMNCSEVQSVLQSSGSAVLGWRSKNGMPLYGRYVSDRRFCRPGEIVNFASVPAADRSCSVKKCILKVHGPR